MATNKKNKDKDQAIGFETGLKELEGIVTALEEGTLNLEESISAYEKGMQLSKKLEGLLTDAQARVSMLTQQGDEVAFEIGQEEEA